MTFEERYARWRVRIYEHIGLDEQAEPKELRKQSDTFSELHRLWRTEHAIDDARLQELVLEFKQDHARLHSTDVCLEIERAFDLLAQFFLEKSRAHHRRSKGMIEPATHYEAAAERAYNQLGRWKW